ncbi:MAG: polysaccharide deacetylase family protein [Chitinophagaceae bacterium]|nr:polysaccharide deacetylase family protein [Bacteroidota bacterium]MCA6470730.1 polysaccharide deacetylase family protein [Chitinophagaceae bacterium]MCA6511675.1 polysaccharide deacetylase family protein [Chitinophagaceae bacterium]
MKFRIIYPPKYESEKQYIVDTIFRHFFKLENILLEFSEDVSKYEVHIICEDCPSAKKVVLNNVLFNFDESEWLTEVSLPITPLKYISLDGITGNFLFNDAPILYGKKSGTIAYEQDGDLRCDVDLFGGIFFLLTLYEEIVIRKYDEYGRFSNLESIICKEELYFRPVVNEYLEILKALFARAGFASISDKRQYQLIVSHDVDVPFSFNARVFDFFRNIFADLLLRKSFVIFIKKIAARLLPVKSLKYKLDPYNNFRYLMMVSEKYSIRSQFNFITVNGKGNIDGNYEIAESYFGVLLKEIYERGHVIGLHPSFETFNNFDLLSGQYDKLKGILDNLSIPSDYLGGRQHYLRWKNPETWQIWNDVGLKYDSSLGSEYYMGFRCGTCFEFPVFNLITKKPLELIEFPLLVMDICAFKLKSKENMNNVIMEINKICRFYNGNMTLLFHNNYAVTDYQKKFYEQLISKLI